MSKKPNTRKEKTLSKEKIQKQKKKKQLFIFMGIVALIIGTVSYLQSMLNNVKKDEDIGVNEIQKVTTSSTVKKKEEEVKIKEEITNVLIMGIDQDDYRNARSDVMMISTIDTKDNKVKLTSLMRDTMVHIPTSNTYQKLNHSYMEGGPNETLRTVNSNLDLEIENFVIFNFGAVEQAVDYLGGYPVTIEESESYDMGLDAGEHHLTGKQAVWYMRIRKNSGGDQGRNQRQRDLIKYILGETKKMSKLDIINFTRKILPLIETSYTISDIKEWVDIYMVIKEGLDVEQYSFPSNHHGGIMGDGLWYAVPTTLKNNVTELHENIFSIENYEPSTHVNKINNEISRRTGLY